MASQRNTAPHNLTRIALLDAGAQYGKVIDRRVRSLGVYCEILPIDTPLDKLKEYKAIIISGGPQSVYEKGSPQCSPDLFTKPHNKPIFGICYGMQLINRGLGGKVEHLNRREDGPSTITVSTTSPLYAGLEAHQNILMSHGDSVTQVPPGFDINATSGNIIAGIEDPKRNMYGVQFHPEVDLTENGLQILRNFLFNIAKCNPNYTVGNREKEAIAHVKEKVGSKLVLLLVSGGVDSTVCAALLRKALQPKQIHAIHINNGFMRKNESKKVLETFKKLGINLTVIDASEDFYNATIIQEGEKSTPVNKTVEPEVKRIAIGDTFIRIAHNYITSIGLTPDQTFLVQGTLRPDLIESASKLASSVADKIKTHHNDSPLAREFREKGHIIEPLKDFHKDEVRELGTLLKLPDELVWRQPFPGPGLSVRIICTDKTQEIVDDSLIKKLQSFASKDIQVSLLPIKTVGVQGDARTYNSVVALSGKDDWEMLGKLAREIPKEVHSINRVVYVFGEKLNKTAFATLTPTHLQPEEIVQLQEADDIVNQILLKHNLIRKLSQVPVILFPVDFDTKGSRGIAIRTFITNDFMTGVPAVPGSEYMPKEALKEMVNRILKEVKGISRVVYDLTSKPPGTTEWE